MSELYAYVPGAYSSSCTVDGVTGTTSCALYPTVAEITARYPDILFLPESKYLALLARTNDERYFVPTYEIDEERYYYALNVLPPTDYDGDMFRMSSPLCDGIYRYLLRLDGRYFESTRRVKLGASKDFLKECRELIAA